MENIRQNTQQQDEQPFELADDLLKSIHLKIDEGTQQLIQTFKESAQEVRSGMEKEFSEKPWTVCFAVIGIGLGLGYGLGHSRAR